MPDDITQEIKSRIDVVEFISEYVNLKPAGANFRGLCPFHKEKNPSFFVSPDKGLWHCFSCLKSGDIFSFVEEIEGVDFPEALRILAQRAGVEIKKFDRHLMSQKTKLLDICDLSAKFYRQILIKSPLAERAREYLLKERQLSKEVIEDFNLGFAPDRWDTLLKFLNERGFKEKDIELSGLIVKSAKNENQFYDRFRNRIIFPITDVYSQTIGFTARIMPGKETKEGKYINTPETPIFNKRKILYGLDRAKSAIKEKDRVILVEGQMDIIACHSYGVKNVVCSSGTALTQEQIKLLSRYSKNVLLSFDLDLAGEQATKRGIDLLLKEEFNVKVLSLPFGKDPDECLRADKKAWDRAVEDSLSIMDYYFNSAFENKDLSKIEDKKKISQILLPIIAKIGNPVEQNLWLKKLAQDISVEESFLYDALKKVKKDYSETEVLEEPRRIKDQMEKTGELFLGLLMNSQEKKAILEKIIPEMLPASVQREVVLLMKKCYNEKLDEKKEAKGEIKKYLDHLEFRTEIEFKDYEKEDKEKELKNFFRSLKAWYLNKQLAGIEQQLKEAENKKEEKKIERLTKQATELSSKLADL